MINRKLLNKHQGFTIVELLVVIVVIGILAALTIVSYTGIAQRAAAATLKADLKNASTKLEVYKTENNGDYPANSDDLPKSSGTTYQYIASNGTYCLAATSTQGGTYRISSNGLESGPCVKTWSQVTAGYSHSCGIASDNLAYCWGGGGQGRLGNNSTSNSLVPVAVSTSGVLSGKTILSISAGFDHTCAIASDNLAYCWGGGSEGQLGRNSTASSQVPVAVDTSGVLSGKTIKYIAAALLTYTTCAIASDDNAYCWGAGGNGQLGNNSSSNSLVPVAVSTSGVLSGKTIKKIASGGGHTCAIASDDNAYCWGYGGDGALGQGSTSNSLVPVAVSTSGVLSGKTIKQIDLGGIFTCAVASDNLAYCWGAGGSGQLGNGGTSSNVPVAVTASGVLSGKTITKINSGSGGACVLSSDGLTYCWGNNFTGQLGDGTNNNSTVPVAVITSGALSGKTVQDIAIGGHSLSIASNGQIYGWGYNGDGRLGNNSTANSNVPVLTQSAP